MDTCIVLVENSDPNGEAFSTATFRDEADILRLSDAFQECSFSINTWNLSSDGWALTSPEALTLLRKLEDIGMPLGEYVNNGFYMGVKTGCNAAFIINESVRRQLIAEDISSSELIKPVLRGRKLSRWKTMSVKEYLIAIASSVNKRWSWSDARVDLEAEQIFAETYPAIYRHLNSYRERLITRDDQGRFYWELRSCAYYAEFGKPKIVYTQTAKLLYACYDTEKAFGLNNVYFIPTRDLSLLAILNSRFFDWYARHKFYNLNDPWRGGRLQFFAQYMKKVPIADMTSEQKMTLSRLVKQILADSQSDGVREIESEIDELVYRLYNLTDAEIELIKQTYRDAGMEV